MAAPKAKARPAKPRRKAAPKRKGKSFIRRAMGSKPSTSTKKRGWGRRLAAGTAKGTAKLVAKYSTKGAKAAGRWVQKFRDDRRFGEGYVPEPGEIPKGKWSRTATVAGGRRFDSPEAAMKYTEKVGAAEPEVVRKERPTGSLEWGRKGEVRVRPPTTRKPPAGRHRTARHKTKVDALIAAHRDKLTKIGSRAVNEEGVTKRIRKAFQDLMDSKPRKLSGMEELALGMEQANAFAAEVVESYRLFLIQKGFDPADLMPLVQVQESYEQLAVNWTKHIVVIKSELAAEIAAARRRASGTVPDDETLAG